MWLVLFLLAARDDKVMQKAHIADFHYCPYCKRNMTAVPRLDDNGKAIKKYTIACASLSTYYAKWDASNKYLGDEVVTGGCPVFVADFKKHQKIIFPARYAPQFCKKCDTMLDRNDTKCSNCKEKRIPDKE